MTRRDFELIAAAIRESLPEAGAIAARIIAGNMADKLAATNPRFDRDRFIAACLIDVQATVAHLTGKEPRL